MSTGHRLVVSTGISLVGLPAARASVQIGAALHTTSSSPPMALDWHVAPKSSTTQRSPRESPDGIDLPRPAWQDGPKDRLLAGGAGCALLRVQGCGRPDHPRI